MKRSTVSLILLFGIATLVDAQETKKDAPKQDAKDAIKEIAGTSEFLRAIPKKFGALQAIDEIKRQVTVRFDGDKEPTTWSLTPDAEIKVFGWWGRLGDFGLKDEFGGAGRTRFEPRVWAWFKVDRAKKPVAIFMLADDLSEQDMHGDGGTVKEVGDKAIVLAFANGKTREFQRAGQTG